MVADERMAFQDRQQKYYEDVQTRQQLIGGGLQNLSGGLGTVAQMGMQQYQMDNQLGPFNPSPYGYPGLGGGGGIQTPTAGDIKIVDGVTYKINAATDTYERQERPNYDDGTDATPPLNPAALYKIGEGLDIFNLLEKVIEENMDVDDAL